MVTGKRKGDCMCNPSYSPNEVAKATGIDPSHIDSAIRSGELDARVIGHQVVVLQHDLNRWLDRQPLLVLASTRE
jgi:hypothetical protein